MAANDDGIVTIRDIYTLVQQVNTRTTELMHQINTVALRAQEDRREIEELAEEVGKIKLKVYTVVATVTTVLSIFTVLGQLGVFSN